MTRVHRIGKHTSEMCVVDRCSHHATYTPSINYACVQAELKSHIAADPVEDEQSCLYKDKQKGVPVVEGTLGAEVLLQIMMKWVWHVEVDKESLSMDLLLA